MNVDTGELRRFANCEHIPSEFTELLEEEADTAKKILGEETSVFLSPDHPLRMKVVERLNKDKASKNKAKRKFAKASRKRNRGK